MLPFRSRWPNNRVVVPVVVHEFKVQSIIPVILYIIIIYDIHPSWCSGSQPADTAFGTIIMKTTIIGPEPYGIILESKPLFRDIS